jgi:hypothetical protein
LADAYADRSHRQRLKKRRVDTARRTQHDDVVDGATLADSPYIHCQVLWLRAANSAQRDAAVKGGKAPGVFYCDREQIGVGDLVRSENAVEIENVSVRE